MTAQAHRPARASARAHAPRTTSTAPAAGTVRPRAQHGFLLWVGVDPESRGQGTAEIVELAETLGELARELLPAAETFTALSLGEVDRTGAGPVGLDAIGERLAHLEVVDHTLSHRSAADEGAPVRRAG